MLLYADKVSQSWWCLVRLTQPGVVGSGHGVDTERLTRFLVPAFGAKRNLAHIKESAFLFNHEHIGNAN